MSCIRERIELPSDLSKQSFQNPLTDSSDRIKLLHQFFLWLEALFDLVIESPNGSLKRLDHLQQLLQEKAVMRSHTALQCGNQSIPFVRSSQQRQVGKHFRIGLSGSKLVQDGTPGFAHQVAKDRAELEVGFLQ